MRLIQGAAGAAGIVIARAVVSDLHSGVAAARYFARLMIVIGLAPILAPLIGGQLLHFTDWRGVFLVLAGIGALLLFVTAGARWGRRFRRRRCRTGGLADDARNRCGCSFATVASWR